MGDILSIFNFGFLGLIYLFLFFVLIVVVRELKPLKIEYTANKNPSSNKLYYFKFIKPAIKSGVIIRLNEEMTIGRAAGCTITLENDNFASSIHARVSMDNANKNTTIFVEDLGSTNGTKVNGKKISKPTKINLGDIIQIGDNQLKLVKKK